MTAADAERLIHELHLGLELADVETAQHLHARRVDHADHRLRRILRAGHCRHQRDEPQDEPHASDIIIRMLKRILSIAALLLAASAIADLRAQTRTPPRPADLVLRGGKIVTVDEARPAAEAIAVNGDTIVAVGSEQEIQPYIGPATRVIDLKGALAVPGLIDAHAHCPGVGQAARNLKLATAKNWDEIVRMVGDAAKQAKPGEWILGRGWHQEKWTPSASPNVEGF